MGRAVVPLTVVILALLFLIQRNGTSWIGGIFGPVMLVWFLVAGALGAIGIAQSPAILGALSPLAAITYLWQAGPLAFVVIGGAFLAVTGGEAFYADMGHFGPLPIRIAWFGVALPALVLNYFGQGGLLLGEPHARDVIESPFYALSPLWARFPLIVLATVATVIASQSIISGAYSMTQQAIALGFLPRMKIVHTEVREIGQIYVPFVNWALAAGTLAAVIGFGSSDALAGAFGIAVSLLMVITTLMATFVALHWKHNPLIVYAVNGSLLLLDLLFFASTSTKLFDGGWFPLLIALVISFLMMTWRKGEELMDVVRLEVREHSKAFIEHLMRDPPHRIPGTAIVLGRMAKGVPLALSHNVNCNHVLHEYVLLLAVMTTEAPLAPDEDRLRSLPVGGGHHAHQTEFRFHGGAQRPRGARRCDGAWPNPEIRSRQGHLLYRSRDHHPVRKTFGPAEVAPGDIRLHASQRPATGRLFQRFPAGKSWKSASNSRSEVDWRSVQTPRAGAQRLRALAHFGRRPPECETPPVMPASENLHRIGRSDCQSGRGPAAEMPCKPLGEIEPNWSIFGGGRLARS